MPDQNVIELRWILAVVRRWIWLIAGFTLVAAAVAFAIVSARPPIYEATATLLIQPAQDAATTEYSAIVAGERLAFTYSEMLTGRPVLEAVIRQMGLREAPDKLAERIKVEPVKNTQLIRFSATASTPIQAALLANTIAEVFTGHIAALQEKQYAESLKGVQDQMDALTAKIEETQTKVQTLTSKKIGDDAEVARLQNLLADNRISFRDLQTDYQSMQLNVAQLSDTVSIFEAARVSGGAGSDVASVTLLFDQTSVAGGSNFSASTYGRMMVGRTVLAAAIAKLGLDMSPDALALKVRIAPVPNTQLVSLSVVDNDISRATLLADAIANAFIDQVKALQLKPYTDQLDGLKSQMDALSAQMEGTQNEISKFTTDSVQVESEISNLESLLAGYRSDIRARQQDYEQLRLTAAKAANTVVVTEPAPVPDKPVQHLALYVALAGLVGILVSLGIAFLLEYLNDNIRTPEDVQQVLGLSTLGTIGHLAENADGLIVISQPRSPIAEAFRVLAANIRLSITNRPLRTLLVTSPYSREGKSMIAANLAVSLARLGLNVVLVDADLRIPRQYQLFGLNQGEGLAEALQNENIDVNLQLTTIDGLRVLASGAVPPNPAEVVSSPHLATLLGHLVKKADLVLIDCPPVLPVADSSILASRADGVLLVLRADQTQRQTARDANDSLRQLGVYVIGVALNAVSSQRNGYYRYYGKESEGSTSHQRRWRNTLAKITHLFFGNSSQGEESSEATNRPHG